MMECQLGLDGIKSDLPQRRHLANQCARTVKGSEVVCRSIELSGVYSAGFDGKCEPLCQLVMIAALWLLLP